MNTHTTTEQNENFDNRAVLVHFLGSDANGTGLSLISRNGQGWSLRAVRFCGIDSSYVHILSRCFYVSGVVGGMLPLSSWIVPHPFPDGLESHPCRFGLNPVPFTPGPPITFVAPFIVRPLCCSCFLAVTSQCYLESYSSLRHTLPRKSIHPASKPQVVSTVHQMASPAPDLTNQHQPRRVCP